MKFLESYTNKSNTYGVLYVTTCYPTNHKLEWLNYCFLPSMLPQDLMSKVKVLVDNLNNKYKDFIYLPIDESIHPGCCSEPEYIEKIANELYEGFVSIFNELTGENYVKLAWCKIELDKLDINKITTLHHVGYAENSNLDMVKFGRTFDKIKEPGIYKLDRNTIKIDK